MAQYDWTTQTAEHTAANVLKLFKVFILASLPELNKDPKKKKIDTNWPGIHFYNKKKWAQNWTEDVKELHSHYLYIE